MEGQVHFSNTLVRNCLPCRQEWTATRLPSNPYLNGNLIGSEHLDGGFINDR